MSSIADRLRDQAQEVARKGYRLIAFDLNRLASEIENAAGNIVAVSKKFTDVCQRQEDCLQVVNGIRNSIVGTATFNWSEHLYPLVAALNAAGIEGMDYPEAREYFGTMLERTNKAEARVAQLEAHIKRMEYVAIMDGCRSAG